MSKKLSILTDSCLYLHYQDIEICCDWSEVEIPKIVFNWNDWSNTTFENVTTSDFIDRKAPVNNTNCYLFTTSKINDNSTYIYGNTNPKMSPKGPWVRSIDFYFKITNITAVTEKYLSV